MPHQEALTLGAGLCVSVEAGADVVIVSNVYRPHVTKVAEPSLAPRQLTEENTTPEALARLRRG